jgi:two-component system LytT family response regulator
MYKIVIIDDEQNAIDLLVEILLSILPFNIKILGTATNLHTDGIELINKNKPDIIFIDINMPIMSGLAISNYCKDSQCKIIFTSGYPEYALNALKNRAFDFVLKPINIVEIKETLEKAIKEIDLERHRKRQEEILKHNKHALDIDSKEIIFNHINGFIKINTRNIEYCSAEQAYSFIFYDDKKLMVTKNLMDLEKLFPHNQFYRTHKSYLVNVYYIEKFVHTDESYVELKSGVQIPVSARKSATISKDILKLIK